MNIIIFGSYMIFLLIGYKLMLCSILSQICRHYELEKIEHGFTFTFTLLPPSL